ncbi:MAG TPA: hypothetical protein VFZ98_07610 [Vicinamibacterales bacterium]
MAAKCSILFINADGIADTQASALRSLGFDVVETNDVPARDVLCRHHAVVVRVPDGSRLPAVATSLRAAPLFGRRVLISIVPPTVTLRERREAVDSGFDLVLSSPCTARDLATAILATLRKYPEHRCVLRNRPNRRREVA